MPTIGVIRPIGVSRIRQTAPPARAALCAVVITLGLVGATAPAGAATPTGATRVGGTLSAVTCTGPASCIAVGYTVPSSEFSTALVEQWNGSVWSVRKAAPLSHTDGSALNGVACESSASCLAVGYDIDLDDVTQSLAEVWNGTSWDLASPVPTPGNEYSVLDSVSCTDDGCMAVGSTITGDGTTVPLADLWNGSAWTPESTPTTAGAVSSQLSGVSCIASWCSAVGNDTTSQSGSTYATLGETWNGTEWSIEPTPDVNGSVYDNLDGVSCVSTTACTAVGYSDADGITSAKPLAAAWNGTAWGLERATPAKGETSGFLDGVSCWADGCSAVGRSTNSRGLTRALAEESSGSRWQSQKAADASKSATDSLLGVSCVTTAVCEAVGFDVTTAAPGVNVTLAEAGSGSTWKRQKTPRP